MYQYFTGRLTEKTPTVVVLETGGIGYQIQISLSTFSALPEIGGSVRLLTHFVVREDAHILYGFSTEEERHLFRLLISISGIGPKSAMTVLSGIQLPELRRAIIDGNLTLLTSIPGIGKKTAERIIVELREKVLFDEHKAAGSATEKMQMHGALVEDSLQALVELGYRKQSAQEAVQKALKNFEAGKVSVPDLIRASLKYI